MAEPRIQYCTAPDGVNLAFCTEGEGLPLVSLPYFSAFGHLQVEALVPRTRDLLRYLVPRMKVIRYDRRGQGLSDRDVTDESLDAHVSDLLTVLDHVELDRVALHSRVFSGPLAVTFAHRYPERVSHLLLVDTIASLTTAADWPRIRVYDAMIDNDWEYYTEVLSSQLLGWSDREIAARLAAQTRAANTPESMLRMRDETRTWDVSDLLPRLSVPTLVIRSPGGGAAFSDDRWSRQLATGIRGAQFRLLETLGEESARAIYEFVTGETVAAPSEPAPLPEGTAIILFTDIVDSTALTEQLGDAVFRARASSLDAALRVGIRDCGGTPVEGKVMGDGVMAVFGAARQAIEAAFRCRAAADGTGLALHLGIHAGDVTREGANVYGGAVNVASRICDLSANDEILVSGTVRELARTSAAASFDDRGEHQLKGITDAVRVYAARQGSV